MLPMGLLHEYCIHVSNLQYPNPSYAPEGCKYLEGLVSGRAGAIGATGAAMAIPHFGPLFKPRYVCTSDSSIHVNIVVVSAVLALNVILTDNK